MCSIAGQSVIEGEIWSNYQTTTNTELFHVFLDCLPDSLVQKIGSGDNVTSHVEVSDA